MKYFVLIINLFLSTLCFGQQIKTLADKVNAKLDDAATLNNVVYFGASDGINGWELWRCDGTKTGTYMLVDLVKGTRFDSSNPNSFGLLNNKIYFLGITKDSKLNQLYFSNGTDTGTSILKNVFEPRNLIQYNGKLYFQAKSIANGSFNLYVTDGTELGTIQLSANINGTYKFLIENNRLLLGQPDGIYEVGDSKEKYSAIIKYSAYDTKKTPNYWQFSDGGFFLFYIDASNAHKNELVRFNENNKTFIKLRDFYGMREYATFKATISNSYGSFVFFIADDGNYGEEVWASDGTISGTKMIGDINKGGGSSNPLYLNLVGDKLLFDADINSGYFADRYAYIYDINSKSLKKIKTSKNQFLKSHGSITIRLSEDKLYFGASYFINPKDSIDNPLIRETSSAYFIYDSKKNEVLQSEFIPYQQSYYRSNNKLYYFGTGNCLTKSILAFDTETLTSSPQTSFLYNDFGSKDPNFPYDNKYDVSYFQFVKNGVIGSKKVDEQYPPTEYGIYIVEKCDLEANIISNSNSFTFCERGVLNLKAEIVSSDKNVTYEWKGGEYGCTSLGKEKSLIFKDKEATFISLIVKDSKGCASVDVQRTEVIEGGFTAKLIGDLNICVGQTKVLKTEIIGGVSPFKFQWYKYGSQFSTNPDSLIIKESGDYGIIITDANGCSVASTIDISQGAGFTIDILGSNTICKGQNTTLTANPVGGQSPYSYQWKQGTTNFGTNQKTQIISTEGIYSVEVKDKNGCSINTKDFTVNAITPNVTISKNSSTDILTGGNVILSVPSATNQSYQWLKDGVAISGATNNSYTASEAGKFSVTVNRNGCTATSEVIPVNVILANEIPNSNEFIVFPNPVENVLKVNFLEVLQKTAKLHLISTNGTVIKQWSVSQQENVLNISEITSGIYLLQVEFNDKKIIQKLFKSN